MDDSIISKISFVGDLMCERPFLKAAKKKQVYDFKGFLDPCKDLFSKSDIIIGNLETPCDPYSKLTKDMFIFNSPISFLEEIKDSGINFLTTATNHCLDRGLSGLKNTIKVMDNIGIQHTGTFLTEKEDKFKIISLNNGMKVGIISFTYGTNYFDNYVKINPEEYYCINSLTPIYEGSNNVESIPSCNSIRAKLTRKIPRSFRIRFNNLIGREKNFSYIDKIEDGDCNKIKEDFIYNLIQKVKKLTDLVIVCPHFGGQFNVDYGSYVEFFVDLFDKAGADLVVGTHPHVVQKFRISNSGMNIAYSLGNISMSLGTPYIELKDLPECSIMFNIYLKNKQVEKISFSILIETENKGFITVYPMHSLYEKSDSKNKKILQTKNDIIFNRFLGMNEYNIPIKEEYIVDFEKL